MKANCDTTTPQQRQWPALLGTPWLVTLLLAVASRPVGASEIVIGVISPTDVGRAVGTAHEETVRFAFERLGPTMVAGARRRAAAGRLSE